jgi:fumarate reductase subunit C
MKHHDLLIADAGLDETARKSRLPAWLDLAQSLSGLLLALFMFGHLLFVSSILVSKDAMYAVTRMFEGYYLFGRSYPWIVSMVVFAVICLFVLHAGLAMRKFPSSYRQYKTLVVHKATLRHRDTSLWFVQVYTGFAMFFLGSAHLFSMLVKPGDIGPYASADRVWGGTWPIDLLLLLAVGFHLGIGLYRLAVKWGWPAGRDPAASRQMLIYASWAIIGVFLLLGLLSLATYMKIGFDHRDRAGERYQPSAMRIPPHARDGGPVSAVPGPLPGGPS